MVIFLLFFNRPSAYTLIVFTSLLWNVLFVVNCIGMFIVVFASNCEVSVDLSINVPYKSGNGSDIVNICDLLGNPLLLPRYLA